MMDEVEGEKKRDEGKKKRRGGRIIPGLKYRNTLELLTNSSVPPHGLTWDDKLDIGKTKIENQNTDLQIKIELLINTPKNKK
jgi:hypothetical protein